MNAVETYQEVRRLQRLGRKLHKQFGFKPEQRQQLDAITFRSPQPRATVDQTARWSMQWMKAYNRD